MTRMERAPLAWILVGVFAVVGITLGIVLTSGIGFADAAGQRLDVPAVSVVPTPSSTSIPTPTPTPTNDNDDDDSPVVVPGPPPVTVELDDHGGDRDKTDDNKTDDDKTSDDNSGHGNSNG